jgi:predicted ATPase
MLNQVKLTNFKAFAQQDLALAPLTLLTGLNSSGKSTVLQALALLRQSYEANVLFDVRNPEPGFLLNGDLIELGTGRDLRHEAYDKSDPDITIALGAGDEEYRWSATYGAEDDFLLLHGAEDHERRALAPTSQVNLFRAGFQYLKADRITPAVSYPRSRHAVVGRGFLGPRGEHTVNYLRTFQDRPIPNPALARMEQPSLRLFDQTQAWLQRLCPGVNVEAVGIEGTDTVRLSYGFGTGASASNRYRPTNVGFGLTYALPIVVACISAAPGSLLLLENPEAHLHPQGQTWLARLAGQAAAGGVQIVMETHSDHVLNGLRLMIKDGTLRPADTAVHFFRRAGTAAEVISPQVGTDGMLSQWPRGFFDEWENSLDQLLA